MTSRLINELSEQTGLSRNDVERIVSTAPHRYKTYSVPKRSGKGRRTIAQPSREVKSLQRIVAGRLAAALPVHAAAHGYVKGRGIKTNALAHKDGAFLLKLDFLNFFPSIKPHDLVAHIKKYAPEKFDEEEQEQLGNLLFWIPRGLQHLRLSIGAPTSPLLSNTIMYDVDVVLTELANSLDARYTRYADDLTFSANVPHALDDLINSVRAKCSSTEYPSLRINRAKTVFASKKGRRSVTGLVIENAGSISLGRERKRLIRTMVHRRIHDKLNSVEIARLDGLLAFASDIEPDFVAGLKAKYGR
jgi:RNA-directed DNA polymerase